MKKVLLSLLFLLFAPSAWGANSVFISNSGAGAQDGLTCASAKPASYFNTASNWSGSPTGIQIGPDTTVHLCGTISTTLTAQGSGTSGHPFIILFESGAKLSQALCPSTGCLNLDGRTDFIIDGGGTGNVGPGTFVANGLVENTASGSNLTNKNPTTFGVSAAGVTRATIQNMLCQNIYVMVANSATPISDASTARCFSISGSNVEVKNSVMHDGGWLIYDIYGNGQNNVSFHDLECYNFGHCIAIGTQTVGAVVDNYSVYNIKAHDTSNWAVPGCGGIHDDGLHVFSTTSSLGNAITNLYVHDNWFYGNWGTCSTAHIFVEGGNNPGKVVNGYAWNNVSNVPANAVAISYQQWFSATTSLLFVNNTCVASNSFSNSNIPFCYNIGSVNGPKIYNLVQVGAPGQANMGNWGGTATRTIDYNFYDTLCNLGNCFVYNSAFKSTLGNWQAALASTSQPGGAVLGADSHAVQNASPNVSSVGVPLSGSSPVVGVGINVCNVISCTGNLAGIANDTTLGGSRTPIARPGGATPWAMGAFQFAAATAPVINFSPTAVNFGNQNIGTTSASMTLTISNVGTASEVYSNISVTPSVFTNANTGLAGQCAASGTITAGSNCIVLLKFSPTSAISYSGTLTMTGTINASVNLSGTGTNTISIPSVPTGLTASTSGNTVNLSWTASTGTVTGYNILRSTTSGGPYSSIGNVSGTTASDSGLANGTYYYVVNAFNSAGTSGNSNQVSAVIALAAAATLTPSTINFGPVLQGQPSATQTVTLKNTGTTNLASITINNPSGPNAPDFSLTANTCGSSLSVGLSCTFGVIFTPSTTGIIEQASIVITSNDPNSPDTVSLSGVGAGTVAVSPTSINFGNTYVNKASSPRAVTFTNNSGSSITFTSVVLTTGTQFSLSGSTCSGVLTNGNSCSLNVTFLPTSGGPKSDTLTFNFTGASGSPVTVALSGKGSGHKVLRVGAAVNYKIPRGFKMIKAVWHGRREEGLESI